MTHTNRSPVERGVTVRMGIVGVALVCGLLTVIGRVYYLQTVQGKRLHEKGQKQLETEVNLHAKRGAILDRHGVELAVSVEVPSVYAHPNRMDAPKRAARRLMPHLDRSFSALYKRLSRDHHFVWLERKASPSSAKAIRSLDVNGVGITTENKRYYPLGDTAGQLLGFVGVDNQGLEGAERSFDDRLRGGKFSVEGIRDAYGKSLVKSKVPKFYKLAGHSVVLTINERIQRIAENALRERVEQLDADSGSAVFLDVDTGEIVALATTPAFDPNNFQDYDSDAWRIRPVNQAFEPGSVVKPFVLAGALDRTDIELKDTFDGEDGRFRIGRHWIRDTHKEEKLTALEIIKFSSNIGIYKIAQKLGREQLFDCFKQFGFGEETGIKLPGERSGQIRPPEEWSEIGFANNAFGQGFSATVVQLAFAMGAVANDGILMEPRLVKKIKNKEGEVVRRWRSKVVRRVVSRDAARATAFAMKEVVSEKGTGTKAMMDYYSAAGKTGTAQKIDPQTGSYGEDLWASSFGGFAPAKEPELAGFVLIDEPKEDYHGGTAAAPVFKEIMRASLLMRGLSPTKTPREGASNGDAEKGVSDRKAPGEKQTGSSDTKTPDRRVIGTAEFQGMPNFEGLSLGRAVELARKLGLTPEVEGWGRVVQQRPKSGKKRPSEGKIHLKLAPKTKPTRDQKTGSPTKEGGYGDHR